MSILDEESASIGGLEAQMGIVLSLLERREISGEALWKEVRQIQEDLRDVKANVATILPVAHKVERYEQWVIAVSALISAVITLVGAGIVDRVRSWFQ